MALAKVTHPCGHWRAGHTPHFQRDARPLEHVTATDAVNCSNTPRSHICLIDNAHGSANLIRRAQGESVDPQLLEEGSLVCSSTVHDREAALGMRIWGRERGTYA